MINFFAAAPPGRRSHSMVLSPPRQAREETLATRTPSRFDASPRISAFLEVDEGGVVDPSLRGLFPRIREAVDADAAVVAVTRSEPPKVEIATLVASIREAFEKDERLFADEDALIAKQVSVAIPRLVNGVSAAFEEARRRLLDVAPWALAPLESELDLLSPLGRARQETAHTQFLAWLMDCRHPHGLGVTVLREFFRLLGQVIPGEDSFEALSRPSEEDERRLRSVRVSAEEIVEAGHAQPNTGESRRCDVWIELVEEGRSLIVVIENKVDAGEHGDQLSAYEGAVWQRARSRRHLNFEARLVFLTPDGRAPGDEADKKLWTPISYRQLACALARASKDAAEPGRTMLVLYTASILRHVLRVPARPEGIERVRQLPFMNEVLNSLAGGAP